MATTRLTGRHGALGDGSGQELTGTDKLRERRASLNQGIKSQAKEKGKQQTNP